MFPTDAPPTGDPPETLWDPEEPEPEDPWAWASPDDPSEDLPPRVPFLDARSQAARRDARRKADRAQRERERLAQIAEEDRKKRAFIASGQDTRQPPEYRGIVYDVGTRDGVRPTAFPDYRDEPQGPLSEAFIAFQAHNGTTYATHPEYYCVVCHIRYNARPQGLCGPCIGKRDGVTYGRGRNGRRGEAQPTLPEYPS